MMHISAKYIFYLFISLGSVFSLGCATHFVGPGPFTYMGFLSDSAAVTSTPVFGSKASDAHFQWPVRRVKLTQSYKTRFSDRHLGLDFGGYRGSPILAAAPGVVVYKGSQYTGYGKVILVQHQDRQERVWMTVYGHLDSYDVKSGQYVTAGQRIGRMGNTGRSTGVHLHFELARCLSSCEGKWRSAVLEKRKWQLVNPLEYFKPRSPSRTLSQE